MGDILKIFPNKTLPFPYCYFSISLSSSFPLLLSSPHTLCFFLFYNSCFLNPFLFHFTSLHFSFLLSCHFFLSSNSLYSCSFYFFTLFCQSPFFFPLLILFNLSSSFCIPFIISIFFNICYINLTTSSFCLNSSTNFFTSNPSYISVVIMSTTKSFINFSIDASQYSFYPTSYCLSINYLVTT